MVQKGLKGVVCTQTTISDIDGAQGRLIYRGFSAKELVQNHSFEEVAHLLWKGKLPNEEELKDIKQQFRERRALPEPIKRIIELIPETHDMLSVLRTVLSAMEIQDPENISLQDAITLTSITPAVISYRESIQNNHPFPTERQDLDHAAYFLYMVTGKNPSHFYVEALEMYMILTMEHGLNASTFSARVTASTETDLTSAITSAIGTMKGPLHGGAPSGVIELLNEVANRDNIRSYIEEKIRRGEKLMGFGHRVYKTMDPRAQAIKEKLELHNNNGDWFDLALKVEKTAIHVLDELKPGRKLYTNVEFYAAAILKELNLPTHLFTATFTASRMVGWTAHVMEQREDNTIFRPSAEYIGPVLENGSMNL